jgi:hypothetical protein
MKIDSLAICFYMLFMQVQYDWQFLASSWMHMGGGHQIEDTRQTRCVCY